MYRGTAKQSMLRAWDANYGQGGKLKGVLGR